MRVYNMHKKVGACFHARSVREYFFYAALDIYRSHILAADIFVFVVDIYTRVSTDCGDLKSYSFKYCIQHAFGKIPKRASYSPTVIFKYLH